MKGQETLDSVGNGITDAWGALSKFNGGGMFADQAPPENFADAMKQYKQQQINTALLGIGGTLLAASQKGPYGSSQQILARGLPQAAAALAPLSPLTGPQYQNFAAHGKLLEQQVKQAQQWEEMTKQLGTQIPQSNALPSVATNPNYPGAKDLQYGKYAPQSAPTMAGQTGPSPATPTIAGIPPDILRSMLLLGPQHGPAAISAFLAKRAETGQWTQTDANGQQLTQAGIPIQRNILSGETKPIDPALSKVTVQPNINMPPQELATNRAYGEKVGAHYGNLYTDLQNKSMLAMGENSKLARQSELMDQAYTGAGGESVLAFQKAGKALGIDIGSPGPGEAGQALSREMALQMRNPAFGAGMPGQLSDSDRNFLESMSAGVGTTKPGRDLIFETRRRMNQRTQQIGKMAREYVTKEGHAQLDAGFEQKVQDFADKNPLFGDLAAKVPASNAMPTPEEAQREIERRRKAAGGQ